jgi:hypothetical protein
MEKLVLNKEIHLVCVRATSFPDGIMAAYQKLEQVVAPIKDRTVFGISHGSDTGIIYWACAEAKSENEAASLGLESYIIKKGTYAAETLTNIRGNEERIGQTFDKLLNHTKLDETGECVEWYKSANEVQCRVRILE